DLMIATVRSTAFLSFNFTTPSGWTEIAGVSDNDAKLYYRVAGASEPGSYTFASVLGVTATMVGSIVAYSGVDPADPIASSAKSTGSGASVTLPAGTATRNGSVVYTNITSAATTTSTFGALTDACDQAGGGVTVANAWSAISAGPVSGLTASLSSSTSWIAQTLVLQPASLCATGGLTLTAPSSISFGATVLDGTNKTATGSGTFAVSDMTDTAAGWNLTGTSTQFTNGAVTLPANATTITGLSINAGGTNCGLPSTTTTTFPMSLPAGPTAPAAVKIYSDSVGAGLGIAQLQYGFSLALPGNTRVGTYTSTWTFTLGSGP
ncbi:MAG: hypothetical protein J7513_15305, partial [Solirubrobacteraceae bacterium]|nr:hypothetical protein [Solirubrobacteraceae bacterium]